MLRIAFFLLALTVAFSLVAPVVAQERDETLADIRQELSVLYVELQRLKRELSTTGGVTGVASGSTFLERINQIEAELGRLTSKTEQLENRINRVVQDGTNRVGDLEFRLVELEGGDVSKLGETTTLGGDVEGMIVSAEPADGADDSPELAVGEQRDFDRALELLEGGDNLQASQLFAAFTDAYPGSPLSGDANFYRGEALFGLGDTANAARAYLESFSGSPAGARAPNALFRLGVTLGELGQTNEACISLGEVGVRFPNAEVVADATSAMQDLNCP